LAVPAPAIFEIATEIRMGRVQLRVPSEAYFAALRKRVRVIPVSGVIAQHAGELPAPFHGDPMDRMIVATALVEDATLITADARILASGVCKTIW
jgi:PIN domain nuclease of toxin-antitoxin system